MDRLGRYGRELVAGALIAAGVVLLLVSWSNIRDETEVAIQMPYILTGGIGALMCTALSVAVLRSKSDAPVRDRLAEVESTTYDLKERIDYLSRLLEAALLPDTTITVPESSPAAPGSPDSAAAPVSAR